MTGGEMVLLAVAVVVGLAVLSLVTHLIYMFCVRRLAQLVEPATAPD